MEYGLSTSLSGQDCYLHRLAELRRDGITCVELCLREEDDGAGCRRAAKEVRAAGLSVFSIHLPFGKTVNPAEPDEARRAKNMGKIRNLIDSTAELGAKIYVIHGSAGAGTRSCCALAGGTDVTHGASRPDARA